MANTQHRSVRVEDDRWARLGSAAATQDATRAEIINGLIAWYLRERGAKLPERPSPASTNGNHARPRGTAESPGDLI